MLNKVCFLTMSESNQKSEMKKRRKEKIKTQIPCAIYSRGKKEETLPNLFSRAGIALVPKADKNQLIKKENYRLINLDTKCSIFEN